jgi:hypothetical protein
VTIFVRGLIQDGKSPDRKIHDLLCSATALSSTKNGRTFALPPVPPDVRAERYCFVSVSVGASIAHAAALGALAERQVEFPQKHLS